MELTKGKPPAELRRCPFFLVLASRMREEGPTSVPWREVSQGQMGGCGGRRRGSLGCRVGVATGHGDPLGFRRVPTEPGWAVQKLPQQGGGLEPEVGIWAPGRPCLPHGRGGGCEDCVPALVRPLILLSPQGSIVLGAAWPSLQLQDALHLHAGQRTG